MTTTHSLETPDGTLVYDVHGPLPTSDGRLPLMMIGQPMCADGFAGLAAQFPDRTVVAYDVRGLGRSTRTDGRTELSPVTNADDVHRVIEAIGTPVEMFASSGGAVTALALVAAHPDDVTTVVAHEPPLLSLLPDAEQAFAGQRAFQEVYHAKGWGHGMAAFIGFTIWPGEFTEEFAQQAPPDPAMFGMPTEDNGRRDDPLLSGVSDAVTAFRPDADAIAAAPTRVLLAVGRDSAGKLTERTTATTAEALGLDTVEFPGGHGGFHEKPDEFAVRLREVLAG